MENAQESIQTFLKEMADKRWKEVEGPYLLSLAGPDLKSNKIDYQAILGEEKLKAFAKRTETSGGYRVVVHPTQKAKVGIVPFDVKFSFHDSSPRPSPAKNESRPERERVVLAFLQALSTLSDKDLDAVVIPTRVLAKLLEGR